MVMDLFKKAKSVRLRSYHDKYLIADSNEENVGQDRHGTCKNAKWTVELIPEKKEWLRLKSCYGKYLTASNQPFLLGMTGKKVLQSVPRRLDSSVEWEPIRDGIQAKLKTQYGQYLRANGGLPPWRNSITHDIPHRTSTQDWILWDVDVVEILIDDDPLHPPLPPPPLPPQFVDRVQPDPSARVDSRPSPLSVPSPRFSRIQSDDSSMSSPVRNEGRMIYYRVGKEDGDGDGDANEEQFLAFKGTVVAELKQRLEEDTGLKGVTVCTRNPLNGKLYPLLLHLPPNNADMHVVVVPSLSSEK